MKQIVMCWPTVTPGMVGEVIDTLKSRWIGEAHKVKKFEKMFEEKFGIKEGHAISVNSGTSALELAYNLSDIQQNDEVITTVLTCTLGNLPLLRRGADILFCDINRRNLNMDAREVSKLLTNKTKAVVVTSLAGIKAPLKDIRKEMDKVCPKAKLIVDACQSLGTFDDVADYTVYSFQAIKQITTGDGGMIVCKSKEDADKARLLRWAGIDRNKKIDNNWQPYKNRAILFDIEYAGYKFHMNDISAGMGIGALREFDEFQAHREAIAKMYDKGIKGLKGIDVITDKVNVHWLYGLLVEERDSFCKYLNERGIETNVMHVRNDIYKVFAPFKRDCPNMDWVEERYIYIPIHNKMTLNDARLVVKTIQRWRLENEYQGTKGSKAPYRNKRSSGFTL